VLLDSRFAPELPLQAFPEFPNAPLGLGLVFIQEQIMDRLQVLRLELTARRAAIQDWRSCPDAATQLSQREAAFKTWQEYEIERRKGK
jgi:hypothetical protein